MKKVLAFFFFIVSFYHQVNAQGKTCAEATPFCSSNSVTFPATTSEAGVPPNIACLTSNDNQAWFYMQADTSGDILLNLSMMGLDGLPKDVDFVCFGPYTTLSVACSNQSSTIPLGNNSLSGNPIMFSSGGTNNSNIVDCSSSPNSVEKCGIIGAVAGNWYMLLITNYSDNPANITLVQENSGATAGSTSCSILCSMSGLTAIPGTCDPSNNTFSLTGTVTYSDPPPTGTLTVSDSVTGISQVFNAPFNATSAGYTLSGLAANGSVSSVKAVFSDVVTCTLTTNYTAPAPCASACSVSGITYTMTTCNGATQLYDITGGAVSFMNPPTTGTLTINNSCGGTATVLNAPFTSPALFSFTGLSANANTCSITATFSANGTCNYSESYTAPAPCVCSITALSATPSVCDPSNSTFSLSGTITYTNSPSAGTLTVSNSMNTTTQVFNPPFNGSSNYTLLGLPASGTTASVTATFSSTPACTLTQNFTAPAACAAVCSISGLTATPSACDPLTYNYSVAGSITFTNPPPSGILTVSSTCGGLAQIYNLPFVSPLTYTLTGMSSNGASCSIDASFSNGPACSSSQNYTAPTACASCNVVAGSNGSMCQGQTLNLTATSITGATYSWTGPAGFTSNQQNPVINNVLTSMSGNYAVAVNVASNLCNSNGTTAVVINTSPTVTVNSPCINGPSTITANGASSYLWSTGSTTNPLDIPGVAATYTVVGTSNGCTDTAVSNVSASAPPVSFTSNVQSGCNPISAIFTADTTGITGAAYNWDFGDGMIGSGRSPSHKFKQTGCHTVKLTVSLSGCSAKDSIPCMIEVFPQPTADFTYTPMKIDILAPTVYFENGSSNSTTWHWDMGDGTVYDIENPTHIYRSVGQYLVTLLTSDTSGCTDSIGLTLLVRDAGTMYVPNSFTPNGDGKNDEFLTYSEGISSEGFKLEIYSRWGKSIFKTSDMNEGWNGGFHNQGEPMQEGVYVYILNYKDLNKNKALQEFKGFVTLVK